MGRRRNVTVKIQIPKEYTQAPEERSAAMNKRMQFEARKGETGPGAKDRRINPKDMAK